MQYKAIFLSYEEGINPINIGWGFANEHRDRWVDINTTIDQISTYDRGTSILYREEKAYTIRKDYVIFEEDVRLYIVVDRELYVDDENNFEPIPIPQKYRHLQKITAIKGAFINTGMPVTEDLQIRIIYSFEPNEIDSLYPIFGASEGYAKNELLYRVRNNYIEINSGNDKYNYNQTSNSGTMYSVDISSTGIIINGISVGTDNLTTFTGTKNIHLFQANVDNPEERYVYIHSYVATSATKNIQLIPCELLINTDNGSIGDIGFWDTTNDVFVPNSSTKGSLVETLPYYRLSNIFGVGGAYIDTGLDSLVDREYQARVYGILPSDYVLFGSNTGNTRSGWMVSPSSLDGSKLYASYGSYSGTDMRLPAENTFDVVDLSISISNSNSTISVNIDGTEIGSDTTTVNSIGNELNTFLFGYNANGVVSLNNAVVPIAYYKELRNGVMSLELYPIKLKDSGLIAMIDRVTDQLFMNSGSGILYYLESLDGYEYLDYLETNGLQYATTDIIPREIITYEMDIVDYNPNQYNTILFGSQVPSGLIRLYSGLIYNNNLYVGSTVIELSHSLTVDTKHIKLEVNDILKTATLTIDDNTDVYNYDGTSLTENPIYLFTNNRSVEEPYQHSACKCSRIRIYTPDEYLLDLYPVYYPTTQLYSFADGISGRLIVSETDEQFIPPIDPDIRTIPYCAAMGNNYVLLDEYADSLDDIYDFKLARYPSTDISTPFGTSTSNNPNVLGDALPFVMVSDSNSVYIGNGNAEKISLHDINNKHIRVVLESDTMMCKIFVDDVIQFSGSFNAIPTNLRLALFTININDYYGVNESYAFNGEIRYIRRTSGLTGEILGNYISAQRISTNQPGYFNTITRKLHIGENGYLMTKYDSYIYHYGLRSTGSQYVVTDYDINENNTAIISKVHIRFSIDTTATGNYQIHGSGGSTPNSCYYIGMNGSGNLVYGNFDNNIVVSDFIWIPYKIYDCVIDYKNRELYIDDVKITDIEFTASYGIYKPSFVLHGYNTGNVNGFVNIGRQSISSVYLCEIYIDDILSHNFVPVTNIKLEINGYLNTITNIFSPCNSIVSQLLPIEEPDILTEDDFVVLDYVESDGTQDLQLDYSYTTISRIEDRVAILELSDTNGYNFAGGVISSLYWGARGYYWIGGNVESTVIADMNPHDWVITVATRQISVDGIDLPARPGMDNLSNNVGLFTINSYDGDIRKQKRYSTKVYDVNGSLLCDLKPAILLRDFNGNEAGSIGLADTTSNRFYQSTTTSLIAGSVKSTKFAQLDYIESDGRHIIDTGFYGTETTEFGVEIALTDLKQQRIGGSRAAYNDRNITFSYPTNGSTNYANADFQSSDINRLATNYPFTTNTFYTMITSPTKLKIGNDEKIVDTVTPFTTATTLKLFDGDGLTYTNQKMIGKLKRSWIKTKSNMNMYFIPVVLLEDIDGYSKGEIGIYDVVTNTFRKSTTGIEFKAGTFLHTPAFTSLHYVEATGAQCCDTGFLPNNESGMKIIFEQDPSDASNNRVIAGLNNPSTGGSRFYLGNNRNQRIYGWTNVNSIDFSAYEPGITVNKLNYLNSRRSEFNDDIFITNMNTINPQFSNTLFGTLLFSYGLPSIVDNIPLFYVIGKMYEAEFTQGSRIVKRFMPASIDSIGWVGFVDILNQNHFIKSMTDTELIAGPAIPDDQIYEELLYGTAYGGAYINTKIPLQHNLMYDIVGAFNDLTTTAQYAFGGLEAGIVRSAPLGVDTSQFGWYFGHVDEVAFVPEKYGTVVPLNNEFHHWIYNEPETHAIKIDGNIVDTYTNIPQFISSSSYIYIFARNYSGAHTCNDFKLVNVVIRDQNAEILGSYKPVRDLRTGEVYILNEYNGEILRNASPLGSITGIYKLTSPIEDGLVVWFDSKDQSGTTWTPKVGTSVMTVPDSWSNGYYSKIPESIETLDTLLINMNTGLTVDLNYSIISFPSSGINLDTQIYSLNNASNVECVLHYTYYAGDNISAYYGPSGSIFNNAPRRDSVYTIPIKEFISDVMIYDGNTSFKSYINLTEVYDETVVNVDNTITKFAFRRMMYAGLNNMTALIKSLRIYSRVLTEDELRHNRMYDIGLFNYYPSGDIPIPVDMDEILEIESIEDTE